MTQAATWKEALDCARDYILAGRQMIDEGQMDEGRRALQRATCALIDAIAALDGGERA